ncbi:aminotransferase class V-fold PLP-dependent enzyme [Epilithonimonas sp. JDS]|uniref:threonine aldolase family protein n=1 Tax=Epilithonimonas sp. JDS TaxID=2902797 RepID=UPI001E2C16AB|nr:aminotransferase class V-fold PLP-dependent enzyme [Epilithonimonas sp. JDS]MCD9855400.1 aminotransferase class V-fold PLP-dependent enzyme [Epilithonimonas sp. JDS]
MKKYSFKNDYSEGCHPNILEALIKTNLNQQSGYGDDDYSNEARELIKNKINDPNADIHFVSGGTQANLLVISSILRPHESVISAETGHIFTNETGAIEATGHKIHGIVTDDGKLRPEHIQSVLDSHTNRPHQLKQKLVYVSNSTEIGTIYQKQEIKELYEFCKSNDLYLFLDGARLGQSLTSEINDLTLEDVATLTDVFYLGGTKNGALLGEAIVITNDKLKEDFGFHIKQKGALLAKGRLLGIQFLELMKNDLYFDLAKHSNVQAMKIKSAFQDKVFQFLSETFTNQIFPILNNYQIEKLSQNFDFYVWKKIDSESSAIRLITSWATSDEIVEDFINEIKAL